VIISDSSCNIAFPSTLLRPSGSLPSGFPTKKLRAFFFYPTPSTAFKLIPFTRRWNNCAWQLKKSSDGLCLFIWQ